MASSEIVVAVVALVVSLIALLITGSQLLGQIFATAEGTRQCSPSVIGNWGKLTSWKWHGREFRFETFYVSPEIVLWTGSRRPPFGELASWNWPKIKSFILDYPYSIDEPPVKTLVSLNWSLASRDGWPRLLYEI